MRVSADTLGPSILGFGGALTESAAHVLAQLPKEKRAQILRSYYDPNEGIGYTLARTHMTSCDFSLKSWSLDDTADDRSLRKFSLAPMREKQLPLIRDVQHVVGKDRFKLLASPWSPPAWMKTNGEMIHGGQVRDDAKSAWADYYVRFVKAMRDDEKIPVWALTVQNEPDAAQSWGSCLYSARDERDFVAEVLGPALEKAKLADIELFGWDHNRSGLQERAAIMLGDSRCAKYLAGLALHWYQQEDFAASSRVLKQFPNTQILFTEGCVEGGPHLNEWAPAERYARNMIGDFNNGVCGFIDWNIALDMQGGPNHVGNFCHAPVLVDTKSGEVHVQPSFYAIAHFSKFVRTGAKRLAAASDDKTLETIAFGNPDGSRVIVIANPGDDVREITISVGDDTRAVALPAHAIQTHVVAA
jgi:glucosylceramidase